jgi:hypothetical protein
MNGLTRRQRATDLRELIGRKACFLVFACVARLQVYNELARDCSAAGVQAAPKLSKQERLRGTWKSRHLAVSRNARQANRIRQADRGATLRGRKKQMPSCSGMDRALIMA